VNKTKHVNVVYAQLFELFKYCIRKGIQNELFITVVYGWDFVLS